MKADCPSSLRLSLSLLEDELSPKERADIESHLAGCARCRQRLEELKRERRALYERVPRLDLGEARPRPRWRPALAAACACLLLAIGAWILWGEKQRTGGVVFKGEAPALSFRVEREGRVLAGRAHMQLRPGDRIRFAYSLGEDAYLLIVNLDDEGKATVYYPLGGGESLPVQAGQEVFLPGSIRLDEYLGPERIFAVFTREPLSAGDIQSAAVRAFRRVKDVEKIETLPVEGYQVTIPITKVKADE
jgi:hypothetical protein